MQICTLLNMNRTAAAFLTARSLGHHLFEFFSQSDGNCMSWVPTPTLKVAKQDKQERNILQLKQNVPEIKG